MDTYQAVPQIGQELQPLNVHNQLMPLERSMLLHFEFNLHLLFGQHIVQGTVQCLI
jgi:hypothetical protein